MKLALHARNVIDRLADRRLSDRRIPAIPSAEMLRELHQDPRAGVNLGRAIALLDAACVTADLPWIGRLVVFDNAADDFGGKWSDWTPYRQYITENGPRQKQWSDDDLDRLRHALRELPPDPTAWWAKELENSSVWLKRALLVLLREAYDETRAA